MNCPDKKDCDSFPKKCHSCFYNDSADKMDFYKGQKNHGHYIRGRE